MKNKIFLLVLCLLPLFVNGQEYKLYNTRNIHNTLKLNTRTGSVEQIQDDGQKWLIVNDLEPDEKSTNRFRLYETKNIWTFIELDTFTGRLWQVQFSVEGTQYMIYIPINKTKLTYSNKSVFDIQPMVSMYQFYLINSSTGEMWQFQWSTDGDDYRWIKKL